MRIAKKARAVSRSIPAPIGGWNTREALGEMDPKDAVELTNWWPQTSDVILRKGHSQHATGFTNAVETLLSYNGGNTKELFAASLNDIYDITTSGAIGAAAVSSLSSARWEYINVATAGGNFLQAVNGTDDMLLYDGTTWTSINTTSSPAITGVDTASISNINLFKTRVYLVEKNTLKVWYLPVSSISGAASAINFQGIAKKGGYLLAMATWTIDAGNGIDDLAVFVTSEGEILVYQGTDPSSSTTWALVGVFNIGTPIGKRCFRKWKGDLLLLTTDGAVSLAGFMQSSSGGPKPTITDKIQPSMSLAANTYKSNFGWQIVHFPKADMILINVPVYENNDQEQYVMNTITGAWARFQGWEAFCWEVHNDELYFGGDTFVGKAWDTLYDNGADIAATGKQAFNYFGSTGQLKRFTMMRPVMQTNGSLSIVASLNIDFDDNVATTTITFAPSGYALWDTAIWDTDVWSPENIPQLAWQDGTGIGYCASPVLYTSSGGVNVKWISTDIIMEPGAML